MKHNLHDSESLVYNELIIFWHKVKIPTQNKSRCITKIYNLYYEWRSLQKSSSRRSDTQENKEKAFLSHLNNLFDIAHNDVLTMVDDKTKSFLIKQRKPNRVGFIDDIEEIISGNYKYKFGILLYTVTLGRFTLCHLFIGDWHLVSH